MEVHFSENRDTWIADSVHFIENYFKNKQKGAIALAGGNSLRSIYSLLGSSKKMNWNTLKIFQTDERLVPPTHTDSNRKMILETLCAHKEIKIEFLPTSATERQESENYAVLLENTQIDITLLGLGIDGHVASLFPNHPSLQEELNPLGFVDLDATHPHNRITMTMNYLLRSKHIVVFANKQKEAALQEVFFGNKDTRACPAKILLKHPNLHIYYCSQ